MSENLSRRKFLGAAGAAMAAGAVAEARPPKGAEGVRILGIACSLRKGKTTAAALQACLDAAKSVDPGVEVELIELAGMSIPAGPAAGIAVPEGHPDDFPALAAKMTDPRVGGIIVGTPVYFGTMSSLCKAFIERWITFRKNDFALRDRVAGVLAVGGSRNGGQERTIIDVQGALFAQDMILVGDGKPTAHTGATLWNHWKDDIAQDEAGMATAKNLGKRVAEMALRLAAKR